MQLFLYGVGITMLYIIVAVGVIYFELLVKVRRENR